MTDLLLPPENAGMPWSRLVEAGWRIKHLSHAQAGKLDIILKKDDQIMSISGPDTPDLWTKLEVKAGIESRKALPKKDKEEADPRHRAFMDLWTKRHADFFGRPYMFNGAADGVQLKRFLKVMPDISAISIMDIAEKAWEEQERNAFCKESKRSTTIMGFLTGWNGICAELERGKQPANGSNFHL